MNATALIPCASSAIQAYAYDPATQTLRLQFPGGAVHAYPEVSTDLYDAFLRAESKGRFYAANIKGQYGSTVEPSAAPAAETEGGAAD